MAQVKLSEFINSMCENFNADFSTEYPNSFTHQDSEGNDFTSRVLAYKTSETKTGWDDNGNEIQKPVFVNISLSKAMEAEVENFSTDWLCDNPNIMVDVDPAYPTSAKIIKQGGNKVNVNKFRKAFGLA